jgi:hypothetical protein
MRIPEQLAWTSIPPVQLSRKLPHDFRACVPPSQDIARIGALLSQILAELDGLNTNVAELLTAH